MSRKSLQYLILFALNGFPFTSHGSPAHGPYGLVETRWESVQNIPGNRYEINFGGYRRGTYYFKSYNGSELSYTLFAKVKHQDDGNWQRIAEFGAYRSDKIEVFLYEGVDYKLVATVEPSGNTNPYDQIRLSVQVWSKYAYYAAEFEYCNRFPTSYGNTFPCGDNQWCRKTNEKWGTNDDSAFWCRLY